MAIKKTKKELRKYNKERTKRYVELEAEVDYIQEKVVKRLIDRFKKEGIKLYESYRKYSKKHDDIVNAYYRGVADGIWKMISIGWQIFGGQLDNEICTSCKHFVGCECFDGKSCDQYEVESDETT